MSTLGECLRERRHALGITLTEISQRLRIRPSILEALEADELHVLPPVYMRQFARRYGEFLGIDEAELRQLCDAAFGRERWGAKGNNSRRLPARTVPQQTTLHVAQALIYGGLVGALVAMVYYFFLRPQPTAETPVRAPEVVVAPQQQGERERAAERAQPGDTLWSLRARAHDTVWLSIIVDGRQSEQLLLYPGQEREWKAYQAVMLSVGNAGGIELWRDGESLPPLGPRGAVLRAVRIERERLWSSAQFREEQGEARKKELQQPRAESASLPQITPAPLMPVRERPQPQSPLPVPQ